VPEKVTISHRGARYEIGMGKRYYAIWVVDAPRTDPVDRWPETADGWSQAWARFTAIETPGTIAAVPRRRAFSLSGLAGGRAKASGEDGPGGEGGAAHRAGPGALVGGTRVAAVLLAVGVLLGVAGLFPAYFTGQSLTATSSQLVPHVVDLVAWAAAAVLALLGGSRARIGGLLGTGLGAVTLGLFASDLATATAGHEGVGAGMIVTLGGWLGCTLGSAVALVASRDGKPADDGAAAAGGPRGALRRPRWTDAGPVALLALCAIGAAASFVPSWDRYTLAESSTGAAQTITLGNAFQNPGWVIFANVVTVVALVAVAVTASLWRPARHGSALLAGAVIAMAGQGISALLQVSQPASPAMFGFTTAQAQADGLTISSGVTSIFWVYVVFVVAMAISCAWLATAPNGAAANPLPAYPGAPYPAGGYPAGTYPVPSYPAPSSPPEAGTPASSGPGDDAVTDSGEQATDDADNADNAERDAVGEEHRGDDEEHRTDNEVSMP
jgi:hypothetical protein